mmetsp:Transcript_8400/g.15754  ORF Transcript_8400/g.15754 Transcript_8400/m.15754 type:complete len:331 (+) Transcript_8400:60-1052(+)
MGGVTGCLSYKGSVDSAGRPTSALIWLHGLGDTERNWQTVLTDSVLPTIEAVSGSCMLIAPRAPRAPVTCNFGSIMGRWFDMKELPVNAGCKDRDYGCSLMDAQSSARKVHSIIEKIREHGIPAEKIAVGGFSQGAAVAMLSALQYSEPLACCIAFSGLLLGGDQLSSLVNQENRGLEILWCHGEHDRIILPSLQRVGCAALKRVGLQVDQRRYPTGHSTHPDALVQAADFLREHLEASPCDETCTQACEDVQQRIPSTRHSCNPTSESCNTSRAPAGVDGKRRNRSTRLLARTKEHVFGASISLSPPVEALGGDNSTGDEDRFFVSLKR